MSWLLSLLLFAATAQTETPPEIVGRIWTQYSGHIVRQDADAVAQFFTADARFMQQNADDVVGRDFIRALLKASFSQGMRRVDSRIMPREVLGFGRLIFDRGDFIETVAPTANPKRVTDTYGRYFAVWAEQDDGTWLIARLMLSLKKQPGAR